MFVCMPVHTLVIVQVYTIFYYISFIILIKNYFKLILNKTDTTVVQSDIPVTIICTPVPSSLDLKIAFRWPMSDQNNKLSSMSAARPIIRPSDCKTKQQQKI